VLYPKPDMGTIAGMTGTVCLRCGGPVAPRTDGREKKYCSPHCQKLAVMQRYPSARWCSKQCANRHWGRVRARKRGAVPQSPYSDREIFERDSWTCHICLEPVDPLVPRTEPRGATIDHVHPIALGGHDVPENVAAAHRECNIDKMISVIDRDDLGDSMSRWRAWS